ncbi:putative nicotinamide N-methyltransferase [Wickerhamomyces ciferrii]|uniref:Nicotinamide N-methyltransferase n=1 Tax=Wickerhamomyces ciferrii (strain ATCC 14091 / BCRC 22168 / CBS 111 / JCM 3599 / NBRC 0793 / NRRL Y-1031 F-60-10) TaxID=1206466 RepID=K0K9B4_WICCF|nr:putative nicotinamide N-methyltransferase [Wickerhamomyces ciferrii]CCH41500.1 putative nicotinamide N-methyltransferase [Wickerhamomyces ciferrii]
MTSALIIKEEVIIPSEFSFFDQFQDLVPSRPVEHLGKLDLTFEGRLPDPGLVILEDGGEIGCGGKVWVAGELLSKYVLDKGLYNKKKVIEIGSGTGLVGLTLGLSENRDKDMEIFITDIE